MRTSLNNIKQIDDYLLHYASQPDRVLFEARLLVQPALQEDLAWQQKTYDIVNEYGRRQLKAEIEAVHRQLFSEPEHISFRRKIMAIFSKK